MKAEAIAMGGTLLEQERQRSRIRLINEFRPANPWIGLTFQISKRKRSAVRCTSQISSHNCRSYRCHQSIATLSCAAIGRGECSVATDIRFLSGHRNADRWLVGGVVADPACVLAAVRCHRAWKCESSLCSGDNWFPLPVAKVARHVLRHRYRIQSVGGGTSSPRRKSGVTNCDFVTGDAYDLAKLAPRPADFVFMARYVSWRFDRPRLYLVPLVLKPGANSRSSN